MSLGRKSGRSALVALALLLLSSGALRIGTNIGHALAGEPTPATTAVLSCPEPPLALSAALSERESKAAAREAAIEERLAALDLAETVISTRLAALAEAEDSLKKTLSIADGAAEGDLAQLTEVYQAMKPKQTAQIFGEMDPRFAAGFLGRMQPEAAAAVLAGMSSDRAYAISVLLAGRNADVPRQ
ncbi:MAG: hypothetical protein LBE86_01680 [Gemmobacter sp.]|jgi:flagellar motility protein MotE (MotC chaperone)|nr:hypothetical protein [Gemmobacter sp.]